MLSNKNKKGSSKKLQPPKPSGLRARFSAIIDNEKKLWGDRKELQEKRREEDYKRLKEKDRILDQKLKAKKLRDSMRAKRRETSVAHSVLSGLGKGLAAVATSDPPKKTQISSKKSGSKKKQPSKTVTTYYGEEPVRIRKKKRKNPFPEDLPPL